MARHRRLVNAYDGVSALWLRPVRHCYKAALYLELVAADWQARFVDYFNGETRAAEYRRINVMGEAPVLEHGDLRLSQSAVILDYLVERFGRYGWNDGAERREILRWLFWDITS